MKRQLEINLVPSDDDDHNKDNNDGVNHRLWLRKYKELGPFPIATEDEPYLALVPALVKLPTDDVFTLQDVVSTIFDEAPEVDFVVCNYFDAVLTAVLEIQTAGEAVKSKTVGEAVESKSPPNERKEHRRLVRKLTRHLGETSLDGVAVLYDLLECIRDQWWFLIQGPDHVFLDVYGSGIYTFFDEHVVERNHAYQMCLRYGPAPPENDDVVVDTQ